MVVFTCTHCGDSLQKPKVEKHYQTVCRNMKSLTCVDCLKDFRDEEYSVHTKCITEEQRYAAKGADTKPIVKKGEVKQESWTELVKSVVENPANAKGVPKRVLDIVASSVNVPRKKNRFINFITSAMGGRVKNEDVEAVWNMIEEQKSTQNASNDNSAIPEFDINETVNPTDDGKKKRKSKDIQELTTATEADDQPISKKRKSKKGAGVDQLEAIAAPESLQGHGKKRKSKNVDSTEPTDETQHETKVPEPTLEVTQAQGKKKKVKGVQEPIVTDGTTEGKSKKRDKSKHLAKEQTTDSTDILMKKQKSNSSQGTNGIVETIEMSNGVSNNNVISKKQKSNELANGTEFQHKKSKKGTIENVPVDEDQLLDASIEENAMPKGDFSLEQHILKFLHLKGTITIEKLQKKVLGAYSKQTGNEANPKMIKKFNKKLKKMTDVDIKENNVTLITKV